VGKEVGILSLHSGANDLGSIMIEENVVSAAGSGNRFSADALLGIIREAGFEPQRRNQKYEKFNPLPRLGRIKIQYLTGFHNHKAIKKGCDKPF